MLNNDNQNWFLTYIFLKKYQFVFNPDTKIISFYNKNLNIDEGNNTAKRLKNNINMKILYIVLIALSLIIFIVNGIILGKYFYKKNNKKKRANELDDNYEYIYEENIN